jgi:uncharacterized protein YjcR
MAGRSRERDAAMTRYLELKRLNGKPSLKELAQELGVNYGTLKSWKSKDRWDEKPFRKSGGQPGNRNSAGHRNAAGHHDGAPVGNKNAEKDGAYSAVFFDMLSDEEKKLVEQTPTGAREALEHEMQILKFREHRILSKIAQYEREPEDSLYLTSVVDMREPGGRGANKQDGANQQMGMYNKDSAFARVLKLQEALYKVQGRIASIVSSLRAMEENAQRMELEKQRLEILKVRAVGTVDVPGVEDELDDDELDDENDELDDGE